MSKEGDGILWKLLLGIIAFIAAGVISTISSHGIAKGTVIIILSVLFFGSLLYYYVKE